MYNQDDDTHGYGAPGGTGHEFTIDAIDDDALVTSAPDGLQLELRAVHYLHSRLCQAMGVLQDEYVSFPPTHWQVSAVELRPFRELDERYAEHAVWGIFDFVDQPGGAFAFLDMSACGVVTGLAGDELGSDSAQVALETFLNHLGHQFMLCWQEIAQFDVQTFPSLMPPSLPELQGMFPGLNTNTPVITTAFRVTAPGGSLVARVVVGIPQAYLLTVVESLRAVGETTYASTDTSAFHERLAYMEDVRFPVSVRLGRAEMTVADLQNLEEGDVIELDTLLGEPLEVRMGSVRLYGKPGTGPDGRRLAVQIVEHQA